MKSLKSIVSILLLALTMLVIRFFTCVGHQHTLEHYLTHHAFELFGIVSIIAILIYLPRKSTNSNRAQNF